MFQAHIPALKLFWQSSEDFQSYLALIRTEPSWQEHQNSDDIYYKTVV